LEELIEKLKQARMERGITLKQICERTNIQTRFLEAIEKNDFSMFAGEVYLKGAIKNYAKEVGLDSDEIIKLYHKLKNEREAEPEEPVLQPLPQSRKQIASQKGKAGKRGREGPSFTVGVAILVLLLVAGGIWIATNMKRDQDTVPEQPGPENEIDEQAPDEVPVEPEPEEIATVTLLDTSTTETSFAVTGVDRLELAAHFHGNCWVEYRVDNNRPPAHTYSAGEALSLEADQSVWIRFGNPQGVSELLINGIDIEGVAEHRSPHNYLFILE
jgi:cytoskeletal protein RodZ